MALSWCGGAATGPSQGGPVALGDWGGAHIGLHVTSNGGQVEYDCAHGTIDEALIADGHGRFEARGVHVREHGGPEREGEPPDSHPARYTGAVDGRTLTMSLTVEETDTQRLVGDFTLTFGQAPRLTKCL